MTDPPDRMYAGPEEVRDMLERKPSARERRLPQEEERAAAAAPIPDIEQDNLRRSP